MIYRLKTSWSQIREIKLIAKIKKCSFPYLQTFVGKTKRKQGFSRGRLDPMAILILHYNFEWLTLPLFVFQHYLAASATTGGRRELSAIGKSCQYNNFFD